MKGAPVPSYFSYAEQTGHYFARPHEASLREPLATPAAWRGPEVAGSEAWRFTLDDRDVAEIEGALAHAAGTGKATREMSAEDFPLPGLGVAIAGWRDAIMQGRGFQVVSGIPVERWSQADAERFFWCLGLHLGRPGAQNVAGDLLGHVTDTGDDAADPFVRLYRTRADIAYHCDAADVVGLLCLRTAKRGGASRIVSSVSVYNEVLRQRPDLVDRLYRPFLLDIRNEDSSGTLRHIPISPCRFAEGRLRTFYHSDYFRSVQRHDDVAPFDAEEQALLDLYEAVAASPDLYFDMDLAPGDIQWLSNHTILHSRTGYEDHSEPARRRHLLRLWLSIPADGEHFRDALAQTLGKNVAVGDGARIAVGGDVDLAVVGEEGHVQRRSRERAEAEHALHPGAARIHGEGRPRHVAGDEVDGLQHRAEEIDGERLGQSRHHTRDGLGER
jgi:hypothetical protein